MTTTPRLSTVPTIVGACLALAVAVAGCVAAGGASSAPSASAPTDRPSSAPAIPSPGPTGSIADTHSLYLRAWQTQALAPRYTFGWLPVITIAEGQVIDGRVAVPAIYPGPLWAGPSVRTISPKGVSQILDSIASLGLLRNADFTKDMPPGSTVAHLSLVVDGKVLELAGDPGQIVRCRCLPEPGSGAAFSQLWQRLTDMPSWVGPELGPESEYVPERLAVLAIAPVKPESGIEPNQVAWPLESTFAAFGKAYGGEGRCAVLSGTDAEKLLPVVESANQLTRFVDSAKVQRSLVVRAMVPGEPSPCGA